MNKGLTAIKIKSLYLVSIYVEKRALSAPVIDDNITAYGGPLDPYICQILPDNLYSGSTKFPVLNLSLKGFWKDKVRRAIEFKVKNNDSVVQIIFFDFSPKKIYDVLDLPLDKQIALKSELVCAAHGIDIKKIYNKYISSILFFDPFESISATSSDINDEVLKIKNSFNYGTASLVPHVFFDTIFFDSIGVNPAFQEIVAFRRTPLPEVVFNQNEFSIPKTVFDIALYISQIFQMRQISSRLTELPLHDIDFYEYLKKFKADSKKFNMYREDFLSKVETQRVELLRAKLRCDQLSSPGEKCLTKFLNDSDESFPVRIFDYTYYDHDPILDLARDFKKASDGLLWRIDYLKEREQLLSEHIHNIIEASSIQINLRLQKSLRFLSAVGIIFTFTAILTGIIPEKDKIALLHEFIKILSALFNVFLRTLINITS